MPLEIDGEVVGSVARQHLGALQPFVLVLFVDDRKVVLRVAASERDATLARINAQLRTQGLITAWRDEPYALPDARGRASLATLERAAHCASGAP